LPSVRNAWASPGRVVLLLGRPERGVLAGRQFVPAAAAAQRLGEGRGELPGVASQACSVGLLHRGEQHRPFGHEPGQRLVVVGEVFGGYPGLRRCQGDRVLVRASLDTTKPTGRDVTCDSTFCRVPYLKMPTPRTVERPAE
jgi:hypothetical protein